ncbi:MAG: hypothetical protein V1736_06805 [Pseudomonadota bacterium]
MTKITYLILGLLAGLLAVFVPAQGSASELYASSWGTSNLNFSIVLPGDATVTSRSLHAHSELGYDISSGVPAKVADMTISEGTPEWEETGGYAWAYIRGDRKNESGLSGCADTLPSEMWAYTWATGDAGRPETWSFSLAVYTIAFNLSSPGSVSVTYSSPGYDYFTGVDAYCDSAYTYASSRRSILADGSTQLYDLGNTLEQFGIGYMTGYSPDSGTVSHDFDAGLHEISVIAYADSKASVVPIPGSAILFGSALTGLAGLKRKLKK